MPLIPHLHVLVSNRTYATCLQYRADEHAKTHMCTPRMTTDIFDGLHYCSLLGERVVVRDQTLTHHYFSDHHDIALGFATNGFTPFKKRKHTVWILLVFNYNLPPDERFQRDNILCVGIIPGPKKPWNADSFIHLLVQELLELAIGVPTYDALSSHRFALHAYLITAFGDIPAVSMIMHMKGHNSLCPCRMCEIQGICILNSRNRMLYVPLSHRNHPELTDVVEYRPERLPLCSHNSFMAQANAVESTPTEVQREKLAKAYGIKGVPLLSALGSLRFPQSFPYNFMHLIWENVTDCLTYLILTFLFCPSRSASVHDSGPLCPLLTYLWIDLAFSRDFHIRPCVPLSLVLLLSVTFFRLPVASPVCVYKL